MGENEFSETVNELVRGTLPERPYDGDHNADAAAMEIVHHWTAKDDLVAIVACLIHEGSVANARGRKDMAEEAEKVADAHEAAAKESRDHLAGEFKLSENDRDAVQAAFAGVIAETSSVIATTIRALAEREE